MRTLLLAARMLARDWRAGELRLLAGVLVIAVASVTTVAFFADRMKAALGNQANNLLGADLVVVSDRPLAPGLTEHARQTGLERVELLKFPSMVLAGDANLLAEIKAVGAGYPLRGELRIGATALDPGVDTREPPAAGTVWVDDRLLARLGVGKGDEVALGQRRFRIAGVIVQEPEAAVGFLSLGPRLIMNAGDLPATGLIQPGSRVSYRLLVAGDAGAIAAFRDFARSSIGAGQRLEDVRDARPEIKSALEKAQRFLGLSALSSVVLAAVAVALGARRYLQRHLDACAMMRCLGASQGTILRMHALLFVMLGAAASVVGCAVGFAGQALLGHLLASLIGVELPLPGPLPALQGFVTGFVLLAGFGLPPVIALGRVPTLRVLRRDLGMPTGWGAAGYAVGVAMIAALLLWQAEEPRLGVYVVGGMAGVILLAAASSWLLLRLLMRGARDAGFAWRFGLANLERRRLSTLTQVSALGLGIMALLLLTLTRGDLLDNWRTTLPPDAPNRFLVNIQPDQQEALADFFRAAGLPAPAVYPMVRGRLVAINGRAIGPADFPDERARRLVDREFNLSWAQHPKDDNVIVAGQWWREDVRDLEQVSVETGIADTLGVKLGDVLSYDVAGTEIKARVTSLRKVEWDSFRVNFFVVAPPGLLDGLPVTFVSSFFLPPERADFMNGLVRSFPNVLVIDVASIMERVRKMMDQLARAVEFLFLFTLAAGLAVLYAAISASRDERMHDAAILRTLGAGRRQLLAAQVAEFALTGALAGLLAAAWATALSYGISANVLHIPFTLNPWVWVSGVVCGAVGVAVAGWLGTRGTLDQPPLTTLRTLG
ncbi:MAG TPA: ABC transporter permease [Burkholderiales bacterium]|nr:ABC transporter permease [Burkholderiales bacterium]